MNTKADKIYVIALAVILVISVAFSFVAGKPDFHKNVISYLAEKEENVLALTAASAALSTAISLLPDDKGTPMANQIAEFTDYFLIIMAALFAERYLLSIIFLVAFRFVIPLCCVGLVFARLRNNYSLKTAAIKVLIVALAFSFAVPASVWISRTIERTNMISYVVPDSEIVEIENTEEPEISDTEEKKSEEGVKGWISNFVSQLSNTVNDLKDSAVEAASKIGADLKDLPGKIQSQITRFIESIAILLVTSCVIPALVIVFLIWILKVLLRINITIKLPEPKRDIEEVIDSQV